MHTVFALLCFVVVIHWLIFPYPSGLLYWHCGNLTIAPVPAKQPWWIWINTSCEFIMNDCITTTKQSTTKPCAYFLGYIVLGCIAYKLCTRCCVLLSLRPFPYIIQGCHPRTETKASKVSLNGKGKIDRYQNSTITLYFIYLPFTRMPVDWCFTELLYRRVSARKT